MTQAEIEVDPGDTEAIAAYEEALQSFVFDLNKLHIQFGAPSYSQIVAASVRPKLTKAGVNEALSGKRLPSREALLEFVRVVSSPVPPAAGAPAGRAVNRQLVDHWRDRWGEVKLLQRQAQAPWKRLRNTAKEALEQALGDAESVRLAAHEEAARVRAEAQAEASAILQAAHDEAARLIDTAVLRAGRSEAVQVDASELSPERKQDGAPPPASLIDWACPPPFWFAVPEARPLLPEDGGTEPLAELAPGTWYLAIDRRGQELVVQTDETDDGSRGVLNDASGISRALKSIIPVSLFPSWKWKLGLPPFWFAVPEARPLLPEDGGTEPLAELAPGTWYLAIDRRGQELVVQTEDGMRGILQDTSSIQRG